MTTHPAHDSPADATDVMACPNIDVTNNDLLLLTKLLTHGKFSKPTVTTTHHRYGFKMACQPPLVATVRFNTSAANPDGNRAHITSMTVCSEGIFVEARRIDVDRAPAGDLPIDKVLAVDVPL